MQSDNSDFLSCINDRGQEIGSQLRSECHGNPLHLHRVIHIFVFDSAGRILSQKRAMTKDIQPGQWDISVGGHVDPGETPEEAARRECREELGIELEGLEHIYDYTWITDIESERVSTFRATFTGDIAVSNAEVDEVRFLDKSDLKELQAEETLTPNFEYELKRYEEWKDFPEKARVDYPIFEICHCDRCPRLVTYRQSIEGKGKLRDADYWNRPVPGFGDLNAELLIVGLAPGAHGANRTGRPFTGDAAGDVLFRTLYQSGFGSKPNGIARGDGLQFRNVFIANAVKCVPPDNKPTALEVNTCRHWLETELEVLTAVRGIVCLGRLAFDAVKRMLKSQHPDRNRWRGCQFSHGVVHFSGPDLPGISGLYHPSRRNLNTGLITHESFAKAFRGVCDQLSVLPGQNRAARISQDA